MKSMTLDNDLKQRIAATVKKRTVSAKLVQKDLGIFLTVKDADSIETIKVVDGNIPANLKVNEFYPIFLEGGVHHDPSKSRNTMRYGRFDWAEANKNPWLDLPYTYGSYFRGTVIRYLGRGNERAGVVIEDSHGIQIQIRQQQFDELAKIVGDIRIRDIVRYTHIGGILEGTVNGISDSLTLNVSLAQRYQYKLDDIDALEDVVHQKFIAKKYSRFVPLNYVNVFGNGKKTTGAHSDDDAHSKKIHSIPQTTETARFPDVHLVVIDDDKIFEGIMKGLLQNTVGSIHTPYEAIRNEWKAQTLIQKHSRDTTGPEKFTKRKLVPDKTTHILLDWNLKLDNTEIELEELVRNAVADAPACRLYWSSEIIPPPEKLPPGAIFGVKSASLKLLTPFFAKETSRLSQFVTQQRQDKENAQAFAQETWILDFPSSNHFFNQIENFLKNLSSEIDAAGVVWVKRERPGYFSIRMQYGFPGSGEAFKHLPVSLDHTPAMTVLEKNHRNEGFVFYDVTLCNIAPEALPKNTNYLGFFSFSKEGRTKPDRVLICAFTEKKDISVLKNILQSKVPLMHRYIYELEILLHMRDLEKLAPLGLAWASIQHEIRQQINNIDGLVAQMTADTDLSNIPALQNETRELRRIVDGQLSFLKEEATRDNDVGEIIRQCAVNMMHQSRDVKNRKGFTGSPVQIIVDVPDKPVINRIPKGAVTRPLINLLDNAVYQIKQSNVSGYIVVSLRIDPSDTETPMHIDITDTGNGLSIDREQELFSPVRSFRDGGGTGMGLYITQKLMSQIGGSITMSENIRWIHATFTLKYPVKYE